MITNPDGSITITAEEHHALNLAALGPADRQRVELLERATMLAFEIINHPDRFENLDEAVHDWNAMVGLNLEADLIRLAAGA